MYTQQTGKALMSLLGKYNIKPVDYKNIPMQPWRYNRKFIELRKIIHDGTVEYPCMFRFCALGDSSKWTLCSLMYREFDLCEFLGDSLVVSIQAVLNGQAGNIIVKLANGIICSVEIGALLKEGYPMIDRHEIITRRGVSSDIVVDTQRPQSSVYTFTEKGECAYKDVDFELYGLEEMEIEVVRSVFEVCKQPELQKLLIERHEHLSALIDVAYQSDKLIKKIVL